MVCRPPIELYACAGRDASARRVCNYRVFNTTTHDDDHLLSNNTYRYSDRKPFSDQRERQVRVLIGGLFRT